MSSRSRSGYSPLIAGDAIVTECLHDPGHDSAAAAEALVSMLEAALT
ncbi:hypothetical protein MTX35_17765 [Rhodococcus sp. ARC_M12]|nr:hypothetical protein [Rhodococcus sp. ARC_M12]MCJ0979565.1 hypothetical protein [Rhodococcus sp. ARC_M12]